MCVRWEVVGSGKLLANIASKHYTIDEIIPSRLLFTCLINAKGIASREGDQYALGCIAYELLSGQRPFRASDLAIAMYKHLNEQPVSPQVLNPHIPAHVEQAIKFAGREFENHAAAHHKRGLTLDALGRREEGSTSL